METSISSATPRPFREIPGLWLKVYHMDETFFADEALRVSGRNTVVGVFVSGVALAAEFILAGATTNIFTKNFGSNPIEVLTLIFIILAVPMTLISFYLDTGLRALGALIFGGKGNFTTLAYLVSLFYVPLIIIAGLLGLIPFVGSLIGLVFAIYEIVLSVRAIKVAYKLGTGRAVGAYFAPVILLLFIPVCVIGILALLGPAIGTIFSNVVNGI